jgi:hypothetical protein
MLLSAAIVLVSLVATVANGILPLHAMPGCGNSSVLEETMENCAVRQSLYDPNGFMWTFQVPNKSLSFDLLVTLKSFGSSYAQM